MCLVEANCKDCIHFKNGKCELPIEQTTEAGYKSVWSNYCKLFDFDLQRFYEQQAQAEIFDYEVEVSVTCVYPRRFTVKAHNESQARHLAFNYAVTPVSGIVDSKTTPIIKSIRKVI